LPRITPRKLDHIFSDFPNTGIFFFYELFISNNCLNELNTFNYKKIFLDHTTNKNFTLCLIRDDIFNSYEIHIDRTWFGPNLSFVMKPKNDLSRKLKEINKKQYNLRGAIRFIVIYKSPNEKSIFFFTIFL
jgi:hypothetical protein